MPRIRAATAHDAAAIAQVYVDSWRSTYAGVLPDSILLRKNALERQSRWWRHAMGRNTRNHIIRVAEHPSDGVIGFASGGPSRDDELGYRGEIYTLYLLDDYHGAGIGKRLFVDTCERLLQHHGPSIVVWVLNGNPARFFYQSLGGKFVARRPDRMGGTEIEELAYGWDDIGEHIALGRSSETR